MIKNSVSKLLSPKIQASLAASVALSLAVACANTDSSSSSIESVSEVASSVVAGAVNSTSSNGTVALNEAPLKPSFLKQLENAFTLVPIANAGIACPTVLTTGSGCSASGNVITLTYPSGCSIGGAAAKWSGGVTITGDNGATLACGTFPTINGSSITSVTRTYNGTIGNSPTTRTNGLQTVTVALDTTTAYGWDYSVSGGYIRSYVAADSDSLAINGIRLVANLGATAGGTAIWDHSVSTATATQSAAANALSVAISGTGVNETRTVNGTVTVQHNLAHYIGSAVFTNVVHSHGCCYPTGGSITTTFTGGKDDGLSETLNFSSTCGSATLTNVSGTESSITLSHCF